MDQLWAPWRMPYITDRDPEPGCIFCTRARAGNDAANFIVFRATECFAIMNLYPYNSGHLMIVPYIHVGNFQELPPDVGCQIFGVAQLATAALQQAMHPDGFNFGLNQGTVAGAGVADHIHLHIVPRWNGDTNFMPVLGETKVLPESLAESAAKLRHLFAQVQAAP